MNKEEKQAIEFFKKLKNLKIVLSCSFWNNGKFEFNKLEKEQFDIILNLIEKQQEQIKKLEKSKSFSKDKMRWRPISEYDTKKYDWVLVKYYDGDFECVPAVAEQRNRKWFLRDDIEIPFEVKYFFDMQELLEELRENKNE